MTNWKDYLKCSRLSIKITISVLLIIIFLAGNDLYSQNISEDSSRSSTSDSVFVMQKSPTGAILRSAVLPGWGQFYNESYWKIPVVWGSLGYLVYVWIHNNNLYNDYKDLYAETVSNNNASNTYLRIREFYRDQRDLFAVYIGLAYVLNVLDAYVDAHMFDFSVSENPATGSPQLNFRIPIR